MRTLSLFLAFSLFLYASNFEDALDALKASDVKKLQSVVITKEDANLANPKEKSLLMISVWIGHMPSVKYLLAHGANVNHQDMEGKTALMLAVYTKNKPMIQLLLDHGADALLKDKDGITALMLAGVQTTEELQQ